MNKAKPISNFYGLMDQYIKYCEESEDELCDKLQDQNPKFNRTDFDNWMKGDLPESGQLRWISKATNIPQDILAVALELDKVQTEFKALQKTVAKYQRILNRNFWSEVNITPKTLGGFLRAERRKRQLSQVNMTRFLRNNMEPIDGKPVPKTSSCNYALWETNKMVPLPGTLLQLAKVLGVSEEYLFNLAKIKQRKEIYET